MVLSGLASVVLASTGLAQGAISSAGAGPSREYRATVVSESVDEVATIVFGPDGARVERTAQIGLSLIDPDGPHGIAIAPDHRTYVVTTAHGMPGGSLWKYRVGTEGPIGRAVLGNFPATVQISPDGFYAWAVNFNLHGDMVPSSVSAVAIDEMVEVARIETCTMPHGSRVSPDGRFHYSACMMDESWWRSTPGPSAFRAASASPARARVPCPPTAARCSRCGSTAPAASRTDAPATPPKWAMPRWRDTITR